VSTDQLPAAVAVRVLRAKAAQLESGLLNNGEPDNADYLAADVGLMAGLLAILRATAARKRTAAAKLEGKAKLLREQANELDQRDARWRSEYEFLGDREATA
jgi:hypothetical protein